MANNVLKVNGIAIANIAKLNGITDANLVKLNGEEFTGTPADSLVLLATPLNIPVTGDDTAVCEVDITSGIDSTYDEYQFHFINIHPATSATILSFQVDTGTNTNYNQPITSTALDAENPEADSNGSLQYRTNREL